MKAVNLNAAEDLYGRAIEMYPFVTFDVAIVEEFLREGYEPRVDFLLDYVLANGYEEEIEL